MPRARWHGAMLRLSLLLAVASPLVAQPTAPRYQLAEDRYLVTARGDIGPVRFALATPSGGIILAQTDSLRVVAYDRAGRFDWSFGRKGDKPGEFGGKDSQSRQAIISGGLIGDTLWVFDRILHRVTYISLRGELIRTVDLPPVWAREPATVRKPPMPLETRMPVALEPVAIQRDGDVLVRGQFGVKRVVKGREVVERDEPELVRMSPTGVQRRRIARFLEPMVVAAPIFGARSATLHPVPFMADPLDAVSQDGSRVATLTTDPLSSNLGIARLTVIAATGDTTLSRVFPFEGPPIPQATIDSVIAVRVEAYRRMAGRDPQHAAAIAEFGEALRDAIPPAHAPFRGLRLGTDGTIWLGLRTTVEGQPFLILNEKGDPIATVVLPSGQRLLTASRTELWAIAEGGTRTRSIIRYRVETETEDGGRKAEDRRLKLEN